MISYSTCLSPSNLCNSVSHPQGPSMLSKDFLFFPYSCIIFVCVCVCVRACTRATFLPILFIHSPAGGHLGRFHVLAFANNATMDMGRSDYFFEILISFPVHMYPKMSLMDHMVALLLIFRGTTILFCKL